MRGDYRIYGPGNNWNYYNNNNTKTQIQLA